MIKINLPKKQSNNYIKNFFYEKGLDIIIENSKKKIIKNQPFAPNLNDLYRLYKLILINKRLTILEFGSGWSTLIFSLAIRELKKKFYKQASSLKRENKFELFVVENEKKYLKISKNRICNYNKIYKIKDPIKINYNLSNVEMTTFNDRISIQYNSLPTCNPDFIYLDAPDKHSVKKSINGISIRHNDMVPMSCDILKLEYFLNPGTIIVCDGRGANASYLKDNLKRKWKYINDQENDQHIFCLKDLIIGKHNREHIEFYRS
ncbi:MAG: hypothetical protein CL687_00455 [Candidatus Pelagibacter sp.]|nr:hypothetical protein [Candidatus Pelagibacter sp.]